MRALDFAAALFSLMLLASPASAADDSYSAGASDDGLRPARMQIAEKNWLGAVATLNAYTRTHPKSADGYNLLGYSYRQLQRYNESLDAYQRALALDPRHRGAHEYIGEAWLMAHQPAKAEEHLATLAKLCNSACEEHDDLKKAIAAWRTANPGR